jgi:hypothetical protein
VPYFLVPIEGDAARAAGLLAVAGIQNVVRDGEAAARVNADDADSTARRVRSALEDEAFVVGGSEAEARDRLNAYLDG